MVAPVTARLVPAFGARASPYHPTSSACPNFCAAGTTGRRSCVQSATVGKDSSEPLFAVHSMPTVRNRCVCFLYDASSRMCLPAGLTHRKEGCALQLFEPSALWSTANSWCRRSRSRGRTNVRTSLATDANSRQNRANRKKGKANPCSRPY